MVYLCQGRSEIWDATFDVDDGPRFTGELAGIVRTGINKPYLGGYWERHRKREGENGFLIRDSTVCFVF
ncbi:hypothetical protein EV701_13058 [Chthoniobacter flavus]|nr:hypothetical protein EV701_13058 [Chthoniobacter flavus]